MAVTTVVLALAASAGCWAGAADASMGVDAVRMRRWCRLRQKHHRASGAGASA